MSVKLLIGADIVPTKGNYELFENGDTDILLGQELTDLFNGCDFRILNLEAPLTDKVSPINKCGPNLMIPTAAINGLKKINPDFYTVANNHIMDQGVQGFCSTKRMLSDAGISFSGAGDTYEEAQKPYIKEIRGITIGIYCCAEHEFSIVTDQIPGANPYDPLYSFQHVRKLRETCDYLIVLYHGGKEHYRYPSPNMRKRFQKFVQAGADLVIAQHSHCIGCIETYENSTLVYGQGNFLFDYGDDEYSKTSLLISVSIDDQTGAAVEYIPLVKNGSTVRLAKGEVHETIVAALENRNAKLLQEGFVESNYHEYSIEMLPKYERAFIGKLSQNLIFKALNRISKNVLADQWISKYQKLELENYFMCESHQELIAEGLRHSIQGMDKPF